MPSSFLLPGFAPHHDLYQQYQGLEAPMGLPDRMDKSGHFWTKVDIFGLKLDFSGLSATIFEPSSDRVKVHASLSSSKQPVQGCLLFF
jgi:hypothetical protein